MGKEAYSNVWTKQDADSSINEVREGALKQTCSWKGITDDVQNKLTELNLKEKSMLVIGSEDPWVEVVCLALGASKATILEYGHFQSLHPQIETFTPDVFRENFARKILSNFDGVVSISSLEHSGLGK